MRKTLFCGTQLLSNKDPRTRKDILGSVKPLCLLTFPTTNMLPKSSADVLNEERSSQLINGSNLIPVKQPHALLQ